MSIESKRSAGVEFGAALTRGRRLFLNSKFRCGAYWRAALKRGRRLFQNPVLETEDLGLVVPTKFQVFQCIENFF